MAIYQLKPLKKYQPHRKKCGILFLLPKPVKNYAPHMGFIITNGPIPEKMYPGMIISYKVSPVLNIPMSWVTEITHVEPGVYFVDEQR